MESANTPLVDTFVKHAAKEQMCYYMSVLFNFFYHPEETELQPVTCNSPSNSLMWLLRLVLLLSALLKTDLRTENYVFFNE